MTSWPRCCRRRPTSNTCRAIPSRGFFFFRRGVLDYLSEDDSCVLEREPLQRLTAEAQLTAYQHGGFWSCVDTLRDREVVQGLWEAGAAPWKG